MAVLEQMKRDVHFVDFSAEKTEYEVSSNDELSEGSEKGSTVCPENT